MNMIRKRKRILFSFCVSILAFLGYCIYATYNLKTPFLLNDQLIFREIASGVYTGKPDGHLVYIMYPLGHIISSLYSLFPEFGWYEGIMFLTFPTCLFFSILYIAEETRTYWGKIFNSILVTLIFFVCSSFFFVQNEFTVNSAVYAATGIFLLSHNVSKECEYKYGFSILSIYCFTMSLWIRENVFYMSLPLIAALLLYIYLETKNLKRILKITIGIVAIWLVSFIINKCAYSSAEWKEYLKYNDAVTVLYDFKDIPDYETYKESYDDISFSYNEYLGLVKEYDLVKSNNADKFNKVANLANTAPCEISQKEHIRNVLFWFAYDSVELIKQPILLIVIAFAVLSLILSCKKGKAKENEKVVINLLFSIFSIGYYTVFSLYFIYRSRYPDRVEISCAYIVLAYAASFLLILMRRNGEEDNKQEVILYSLCSILIIALLVKLLPAKMTLSAGNWFWKTENVEITQAVIDVCNENPENVYFVENRISTQTTLISKEKSTYSIPPNYLSLVFWITRSPVEKERLARLNIDYSIDKIQSGEGVYFVCYDDYDKDWLTDLCKEYGSDISLEVEEEIETLKGIIHINKVNAIK